MSDFNPTFLNPLVLAFYGDSVWEIFAREEVLLAHGNVKSSKLHNYAVEKVRASFQAQICAILIKTYAEHEDMNGKNPQKEDGEKNTSESKSDSYLQSRSFSPVILTPEEYGVLRRGLNVRLQHVPKSSNASEYIRATALEALIGWLSLSGNTERAKEIFCCFSSEL